MVTYSSLRSKGGSDASAVCRGNVAAGCMVAGEGGVGIRKIEARDRCRGFTGSAGNGDHRAVLIPLSEMKAGKPESEAPQAEATSETT